MLSAQEWEKVILLYSVTLVKIINNNDQYQYITISIIFLFATVCSETE